PVHIGPVLLPQLLTQRQRPRTITVVTEELHPHIFHPPTDRPRTVRPANGRVPRCARRWTWDRRLTRCTALLEGDRLVGGRWHSGAPHSLIRSGSPHVHRSLRRPDPGRRPRPHERPHAGLRRLLRGRVRGRPRPPRSGRRGVLPGSALA